jgi:hypothetical protein
VGSRVGLDGCGKSRPHRDSIPGPSSQSWNSTVINLSGTFTFRRHHLTLSIQRRVTLDSAVRCTRYSVELRSTLYFTVVYVGFP